MHLKRYKMPGFWGMGVKKEKFVVFPRGSHPKDFCIPLQAVLRNILGLASTRKEARSILSEGKVLVDKKARKDGKFSVGLMDIIEIPDAKKSYRIEVGKGGLLLKDSRATDKKLCRIKGKTVVKGGKEQLNLHDGRCILAGKGYRVGDTIEISLPDQKILSHYPLKKGSQALVIAGKNTGVSGVITSLPERKYMLEKVTVSLDAGGKKIETLREYVFVIGEKAAASEKPGQKSAKGAEKKEKRLNEPDEKHKA